MVREVEGKEDNDTEPREEDNFEERVVMCQKLLQGQIRGRLKSMGWA